MTIPIPTTPGRSGFNPQLALTYDSGTGNGRFGLGWNLALPAITRRIDHGLPRYDDGAESDVFVLSGEEDLVRSLRPVPGNGDRWELDLEERDGYGVQRYHPRTEGMFARLERWMNLDDPADTYWRAISRANVTTFYGRTAESRIADPADPRRVFSWLTSASHDDRGNAVVYEYKAEDSERIFEDAEGQLAALAHEANLTPAGRAANRFIKQVRWGNRVLNLAHAGQPTDPAALTDWRFDLVFDSVTATTPSCRRPTATRW